MEFRKNQLEHHATREIVIEVHISIAVFISRFQKVAHVHFFYRFINAFFFSFMKKLTLRKHFLSQL